MNKFICTELRPLVSQLRKRYPQVRIIEATLTPNDGYATRQTIRYQAPFDVLRQCGLYTDEMLARDQNPRRAHHTHLGEGWTIAPGGIDDLSDPDLDFADLFIYTAAIPREPDHFRLTEARREINRLLKRWRAQVK